MRNTERGSWISRQKARTPTRKHDRHENRCAHRGVAQYRHGFAKRGEPPRRLLTADKQLDDAGDRRIDKSPRDYKPGVRVGEPPIEGQASSKLVRSYKCTENQSDVYEELGIVTQGAPKLSAAVNSPQRWTIAIDIVTSIFNCRSDCRQLWMCSGGNCTPPFHPRRGVAHGGRNRFNWYRGCHE